MSAHRGAGNPATVAASCTSRLERCLPARPECIGPLRRALVAYAESNGAYAHRCDDIALAASEALSNAVVHAYAGQDRPGDVRVEAWIQGDGLQIAICDEGLGIAPRLDSPGLGLGLSIIGRVCDQLVIESHDGDDGARVQMSFASG